MIICDRCKKIPKGGKSEPFLYEIIGLKMEETKTGKKGTAVGREIVKIPMHLCDECITAFNAALGHFVSAIRGKVIEEDQPSLVANEGFVS